MAVNQYLSPNVFQRLRQTQPRGLFAGSLRGVEKESLRVTPEAHMSSIDHPIELGRALTNPLITTDFAECLLEFVTMPHDDPKKVIEELQHCHQFAYEHIGDEIIWNSSMPCIIGSEDEIPLAKFGTSNSGKMKHVYRRALSLRYGSKMQTIAGIHYNFSFGPTLWEKLKDFYQDESDLQDFRNKNYMKLIRNYLRYVWVIPYLLGASPSLCKSFLKDESHSYEFLKPLNSNSGTLYAPNGTSLRMSSIGYSFELNINYDDIHSYLKGISTALDTKVEAYERIGVKGPDGEYRQLNTNLLQIENEYYNPIRPKQPAHRGERVTKALLDRGIDYIEVRAVDINPFLPVGIDETTMLFLDVFITFCLLERSCFIGEEENLHMKENLHRITINGRDPNLTVFDLQKKQQRLLRDWLKDILGALEIIAQGMDEDGGDESGNGKHVQAVREQSEKLRDPTKLPSSLVLEEVQKKGFIDFAMQESLKHAQFFKSTPLPGDARQRFVTLTQESIREQEDLEESSRSVPFDDYLHNYFSYHFEK